MPSLCHEYVSTLFMKLAYYKFSDKGNCTTSTSVFALLDKSFIEFEYTIKRTQGDQNHLQTLKHCSKSSILVWKQLHWNLKWFTWKILINSRVEYPGVPWDGAVTRDTIVAITMANSSHQSYKLNNKISL